MRSVKGNAFDENDLLLSDFPRWGRFRFFFLVLFPLFALLISSMLHWFLGWASQPVTALLLLYFLGLVGAFAGAVYYIKDIYDLDKNNIPFQYFLHCFFGLISFKVVIEVGQKKSKWLEVVEKIGGPANLDIRAGYAVLTESLQEPKNVFRRGKHFLTRLERIYEVIDLHEQEGNIPEIKALSQDGQQVIVNNIKFTYRLWDSRWENLYANSQVQRRPFPCSKQAVLDYAYNRVVPDRPPDKPDTETPETTETTWRKAVTTRVSGIIKDYIAEHPLNHIIAPLDSGIGSENPREAIRKKAFEPGFKERMRDIGAILVWWDPGEYKTLKDVEDQHFKNWSADLHGEMKITQAYGEAQKAAYEELGRAEAEAELLMSIIHSLDGNDFGSNKTSTMQKLILMRTAQVIKALNTNEAPPGSQ